jgi:hypothetical protein
MLETIRRIIRHHPHDVFVSPATGGGQKERFIAYGRQIVPGDCFDEFVANTYKRLDVTQ